MKQAKPYQNIRSDRNSIINLENNTMDLDFFKRIRYLCWDNDDLYKLVLHNQGRHL